MKSRTCGGTSRVELVVIRLRPAGDPRSRGRNFTRSLGDPAVLGGFQPAQTAIYQLPVFGIDFQGSAGGRAPPFCRSSMEMLSGERTKAMRPSRGGRLMVTPPAWSFAQAA